MANNLYERRAIEQTLDWMQANQPQAYRRMMAYITEGGNYLAGLGQTDTATDGAEASFWDSFKSAVGVVWDTAEAKRQAEQAAELATKREATAAAEREAELARLAAEQQTQANIAAAQQAYEERLLLEQKLVEFKDMRLDKYLPWIIGVPSVGLLLYALASAAS